MAALIKRLHGFVCEIAPTNAEWFKVVDWLTCSGQISDNKRQEMILFSDVTGVSMLIDATNHRFKDGTVRDGLYESQRNTDEPRMRDIFHSKADGSYCVRTVVPIAYTIPMDGTVGELVSRTNISRMRPAHIHFAVEAPGYRKW